MMKKNKFVQLWGAPIILAILTIIGLVWALLKDGYLDIISCFILLIPIVIIATKYYYLKKITIQIIIKPMKKAILSAAILTGTLVLAQKEDSINSKSIDEVILNKIIKKETESTSKMPLKAIEDPQVYSSVDKSVLQNQLIFNVDDAFRNVTGLQLMWGATSRSGDGGSFINLRGFIGANSMRNGLIGPVTSSIDAINIEKIEVLKGPSATLFGSTASSYGGIINRVTKKPFDHFKGEVSLIGGSYNYYRAQADINTPLTKDNRLMLRVNTAYTTQGSFQDKNAKNTQAVFMPSLRYKIDDRLDINLEFENFETRATPDQFIFYLTPDLGKNMHDVENLGLDYKNSYMPAGLYTNSKVRNLFGQINVKINDFIKSSTNVSSSYSYSDGFNPYFFIAPKLTITQDPNDTELGIIRSDQSTRDSKKTYFQVQQNFNADFKIGEIRNRTVAGFDYMQAKDKQMFLFLSAYDWVPFKNGDYSAMTSQALAQTYHVLENTPGYDFDAYNTYPIIGTLKTTSGYISNVLTPVDGLNILTSIRYENNKYLGGKKGQANADAYTQAAWSPKLGLTYEFIKNKVSVFGNYQNSFKSNGYYISSNLGNLQLSKPERANQFEGGFKANLINSRLNATVNYYNIQVKNTLLNTGEYLTNVINGVPTPDYNKPVQAEAGALVSKGIELEVNAYLIKGFSVIAGVSYNDMKYTEMNEGAEDQIGRRPDTGSSPWLANFNASYQFLDGKVKGLGFGFGGNYASDNKIVNSAAGTFVLPKYLVLNANAFYDTQKFRIGVKVDNLTNEHYWNGYSTANPQKLMNIVGNFTYKF